MIQQLDTFATSEAKRRILQDAIRLASDDEDDATGSTWRIFLIASYSVENEAQAEHLSDQLKHGARELENTARPTENNLLLFVAREVTPTLTQYKNRNLVISIYDPFDYGFGADFVSSWVFPKNLIPTIAWERCPHFAFNFSWH